MKFTTKWHAMVASTLMLSSIAVPVFSKSVSGKQDLVCASMSVMACAENAMCMEGQPHTFDLPTFLFVDFKAKKVRGTDDDGADVVSAIKAKDITENAIILQGSENHRGWAIAINKTDGSFNLSSTGSDVSFIIMGNCTTI